MLRRSCKVLGAYGSQGGFTPPRTVGAFGLAFVNTGNTAVIERFGKFRGTAAPGLTLYIPFIDKVRLVSNRVEQATYQFEVKTRDNIFAELQVAVQVEVMPEDSPNALYKMADPARQIHALLDAEIRAQASSRNLDDMFEQKEEMSQSVFTAESKQTGQTVAAMIKAAGFTLHRVLIRGIEPDAKVKAALNEINASQRMREATKHQADAQYITAVREAEADRDRKRLLGEGVSLQRLAIMNGYQEGVNKMAKDFQLSPREVVDFVVKTQHLDTVEAIGKSPNCKTLFLSHEPLGMRGGGAGEAVMVAQEAQHAPQQ
jgi:regulator of protease activity HflC (stomatin/prohibitin superfamily)